MMRRPLFLLLPLALLLGGCEHSPIQPTAAAPDRPNPLLVSASGYTEVSAELFHTCALTTAAGAIACWGDNGWGRATPPAGSFTEVSAGYYHTCAIRVDGTLACWGLNDVNIDQATPPAGRFTQLDAGDYHNCALRTDGTLACWGGNWNGQATPPAGTFTQVSAGYSYSCGVRTDGSLSCWGSDSQNRTDAPGGTGFVEVSAGGAHACARKSDGTISCWGLNGAGQASPPAGSFEQVSAGFYHTCALTLAGAITCWGENSNQRLDAPTGTGYEQISVSINHSCAVMADGTMSCWGFQGSGAADPPSPPVVRLLPTASFSATPAAVLPGQTFTLALSNAQVPGYAGAVFTYAFDCGTGYGDFSTASTATCTAPGSGTGTVRGTVKDQDGDTQEYTTTVTVTRLAVAIDLKPGSSTNPISLTGAGDNVIPVAVLSSVSFDAPTLVAVATATLGDGAGKDVGVALRTNGSFHTEVKDVNRDKRPDLVLYFRRADLIAAGALTSATTQLVLLAELTDGRQVRGEDAVRVQ